MMYTSLLRAAALFVLLPIAASTGQTWSVQQGATSVQLDADTLADDSVVPGIDTDLQTDSSFQYPFIDLNGVSFDFGENVSAQASQATVQANAASVVKGNEGSSFTVEWRSATDLEMRDDTTYTADGHTTLTSDIEVELSGLIPGRQYKITYDYLVSAIAIEDHEGLLEDPEDARSAMSFVFGTAPSVSAQANAGPSAGFPSAETTSDNGMYMLTATAQPITLSVSLAAAANAVFNDPAINGSPPEDGAGSEGFGRLTFRAELKPIPEPASLILLAGMVAGGLVARRSIG